MTSWRPYLCPKTMKRRPCLCPKPVLWELNSFLMQTLSFVPINLHRCWPREWKHKIGAVLPISGQMAVAHMEVTFCVWLISPRWIASGKFPWYVKKNQRRNFNLFKLRHRVSNTLRKELMWQESWADPRKLPEWKGRDLRLVSSIEVQFWPLSLSPSLPLPPSVTQREGLELN